MLMRILSNLRFRSCLWQQRLEDVCCVIYCSLIPVMNRGGRKEVKIMCELGCCMVPILKRSSSLVVLFLAISSGLIFCSSPLVPTALKLSLLEDSHSFFLVEKMGNPACRQHMMENSLLLYLFIYY